MKQQLQIAKKQMKFKKNFNILIKTLKRLDTNKSNILNKMNPINLLRITITVSACEFLHQSVDFLRFPRKSEALEKQSQARYEIDAGEVEEIDVGVHDFLVYSEVTCRLGWE